MFRGLVRLSRGSVVRVAGPAGVRVVSGRVSVLGKILSPGSETFVSVFKSLPLYALEDSEIDVNIGEGGYIESPREREEVLPEWLSVAEKISERGSRVVVMGPGESGKSTFSTLLLNTSINKGLRTCVIDADLGQQDIGPPGFIAMACPTQPVQWLRELYPDEVRICGTVTPSQYPHRLVAAVSDLARRALERGAEILIVNTDGWVGSPYGIEMKLEIARYIGATHIVALNGGAYLGGLYGDTGRLRIVPLPSPQGVRTRSREDRRALRTQAYRKFFEQASLRTIEMGRGFVVIGSCLASGSRLDQERVAELEKALGLKILYGSLYEDSIYLYIQAQDRVSQERQGLRYQNLDVYLFPQGSEKGLLASLLDRDLNEVAPAILDTLDLSTGVLKVVTRYQGPVAGIVIGRVKLDSLYDDSTRYSRCPI